MTDGNNPINLFNATQGLIGGNAGGTQGGNVLTTGTGNGFNFVEW